MINKLTDEQRDYLRRGIKENAELVSTITEEFKSSGGRNMGNIYNSPKSTTTTRTTNMVSGRVGEEDSIGGGNSSESTANSRDGGLAPYDRRSKLYIN